MKKTKQTELKLRRKPEKKVIGFAVKFNKGLNGGKMPLLPQTREEAIKQWDILAPGMGFKKYRQLYMDGKVVVARVYG